MRQFRVAEHKGERVLFSSLVSVGDHLLSMLAFSFCQLSWGSESHGASIFTVASQEENKAELLLSMGGGPLIGLPQNLRCQT